MAGDPRTTQLTRQTLEEGQGHARAGQLVRQVIGQVGTDPRTSQIVRQVIAEIHVSGRTTQLVRQVIADGVPCVRHWQQLWRIKRKDGRVFTYTSLDEDFRWGLEVYKACGSLMPSASADASALGQVSNQELKGILTDDGITERDLYGGLFDDAFVEVWLVPYQGTESPRRIAAGWTGNIQHQEGTFNLEVVGPGSRLDQQAIVQNYGPGCRWVFGSPECGYDREAKKVQATVTVPFTRGKFIAEGGLHSGVSGMSSGTGSSGGMSSGEFDGGDVDAVQWSNGLARWLTGENAGIECEVKTATFDGGIVTVELWDLSAFLMAPGDELEILPGCDLSFPTCSGIYFNGINFGGFKDVPGEDAVMQTPDAKV